jgi:hypothetical protein
MKVFSLVAIQYQDKQIPAKVFGLIFLRMLRTTTADPPCSEYGEASSTTSWNFKLTIYNFTQIEFICYYRNIQNKIGFSSSRTTALSWRRGLRALVTRTATLAGAEATGGGGGLPMLDRSKCRGPAKCSPWSRLGVGRGAIFLLLVGWD